MPRLAVVIGRFQPVHRSHLLSLIQRGTNQDGILILLGSALATPTPKNPFSWEFRKEMILAGCKELGIPTENLLFSPLRDTPNDASWEDDRLETNMLEVLWDRGPVGYRFENWTQVRARHARTWAARPTRAEVISGQMAAKTASVVKRLRK